MDKTLPIPNPNCPLPTNGWCGLDGWPLNLSSSKYCDQTAAAKAYLFLAEDCGSSGWSTAGEAAAKAKCEDDSASESKCIAFDCNLKVCEAGGINFDPDAVDESGGGNGSGSGDGSDGGTPGWLIAVIVLLVLFFLCCCCALCIGGWWYKKKRDDNDSENRRSIRARGGSAAPKRKK
eukprot:GEMP01038083.1.p1 GENE.GEMP01038083.1~~GEMP01038083.1.p1  ORF type:complete len:177 (+),score=49.93 GEMP01038083.1:320-850(+)